MPEIKKTIPHQRSEAFVRKQIAKAIADQQREHPGYKIRVEASGSHGYEVKFFLTPMTVLTGRVVLLPSSLLFILKYPGYLHAISGSEIREYTNQFEREVARYLGEVE